MKNNGSFVDTRFLRDHVSKLRQEKKIAYELYESVVALKNLDDPSLIAQYNSILRDVNQLIEYFTKMAETLDQIDDEAVYLSHRLGDTIESDTIKTRRTVSEEIQL